jgi:hypothetical protein
LPDGQILSQITQKRHQKNWPWPEKIGGLKMTEFGKGAENRPKNIFTII